MKRYLSALISALILVVVCYNYSPAQDVESLVKRLTTIDPEIQKYFPRWRICEPDLQIQIYRTFVLLGYDKDKLNMQQVQVLAAPQEYDGVPYELLLISCGEASLNSVEIETNMSGLAEYISGSNYYSGPNRGQKKDFATRDYCHDDIKPDIPVTNSQAQAIVSFLEPTNVVHAFTVSLFEQTLKIGNSGFWLKSSVGTDEVGYHFWTSGEARVVLKRPLYANMDLKTRDRIPFLINAYIGGGYRITSGIEDNKSALSWVGSRNLNGGPGGKFVAGLDFHMPFHPQAGLHVNMELPFSGLTTEGIEKSKYGKYTRSFGLKPNDVKWIGTAPGDVNLTPDPNSCYIVPVLRSTGQVTLFYNWWLNEANPENFMRFDLGIDYFEVNEYLLYRKTGTTGDSTFITNANVRNLKMYKPNEFGDWVYAKVEYRNQAAFPFGVSIQYSNQILLGRVYIPLLGQWFYLEGKYATPLRGVRPFEKQNFFMISPVLRLTI